MPRHRHRTVRRETYGFLSHLEALTLDRREARGRFADRVLRRLRDE